MPCALPQEFELFLQKKFVSEKRFGIDGGESLIAGKWRRPERAFAPVVRDAVA
jgi:hypothetical protein